MEPETRKEASSTLALSSFASAVELALGELLLLTGRPDELMEHLWAIHINARATLMASDLEAPRELFAGRASHSQLPRSASLQAWHDETKDLTALGDAVALLEEVHEEVGVRYVAPPSEED